MKHLKSISAWTLTTIAIYLVFFSSTEVLAGWGDNQGWHMGPGMMGYGERGGYGMMGPDRGYPQRYGRHMGSLEEKDARKIVENYIASTRNPNLKVGKITDAGNTFRAQIVTRDDSLVEEVLIDKESGSMRSAY